jgi:hypothetical protein
MMHLVPLLERSSKWRERRKQRGCGNPQDGLLGLAEEGRKGLFCEIILFRRSYSGWRMGDGKKKKEKSFLMYNTLRSSEAEKWFLT